MPIIQLPNGQNAEFPDDMSMDEIKSVLQKKFPPMNNSQSKSNNAPNSSFLQKAGNWAEQNISKPFERNVLNPANSMSAGFEQGLGNIAPGLANLGISGANALGANIPKVPMLNFAPNDASAMVGNAASFFVPGGAAGMAGKIPELAGVTKSAMSMPIIANAIKNAGNILSKAPTTSKIAGNAILGGAYSPDHPLLGMAMGGSLGALGTVAGKGFNALKNEVKNNEFLQNMVSKITPEKHAKNIMDKLSNGANNFESNSKNLIKDIQKSHDAREEEAGIFLNHALDQAGSKKIYEHVDPLISTALDKQKMIMGKINGLNVGDLYQNFKKSPTFQNAHKLQSELGTMIGDLEKKPYKTPDENLQLSSITSARNQLKDDINSFLERHDLSSNIPIANAYKKGIDLYRENVAPYLSSKKLREVVRGRKTNVKNIHNEFVNPSNKVSREGVEKIGAINKIISDLPFESKNKILFNAIGGNKSSANALLDSLENARSKGFGSYFTPETEEEINMLNQKIKNKNRVMTGSKIAGIGTLAGLTGNALSHFI